MREADRERPFVEPTITPEASLTDVTLLSGGYGKKKHGHDSHNDRYGHSHSTSHGSNLRGAGGHGH